jgi:sugar-phosphatase
MRLTQPTLRCSAVLFDLDGVLVDSAPVVVRTWTRWVARHDLDIPDLVRRAHG